MTFCATLGWLLLLAAAAVTVSGDTTTTASPKCEDTFQADIYMLCDASNSINYIGWGRQLAFVDNFTKSFPFGPQGVQIGFGIFSTNFKHIANLNSYAIREDFSKVVLSTEQMKKETYTYLALEAIIANGYLTSPSLGAKKGVPKYLFVMTDGKSRNTSRTVAAADELRKLGVTTFCVGVGVENAIETLGIAGNEKNYFRVKSFGFLESFRAQIARRVCEAKNDPEEKPCPAIVKNDIVFVIDSSASIGPENYIQNTNFLAASIPRYTLSEEGVKIGVLTYGSTVSVICNLTSSKNVLYEALEDLPYKNTTTNTHLGLYKALLLFSTEYGGRVDANKTAVLISDGKSSKPDKTLEVADLLKSQGINIFCLGIKPDADERELKSVASRETYYLPVANYSALVSYANVVSNLACYAPPPPPTVKPCPKPIKVDIIFLMDSSGSIGAENYHFNFDFIKRICRALYIAEDGAKIAMATYGTSVKPKLNFSSDKDYIESQLENVPYQNSTTNTHLALSYAINSFKNLTSGARYGVPKMAIAVTDGKSTVPGETVKAAEELKKLAVVVCVAVGDKVDEDEINIIASGPEHVKKVGDYNLLEDLVSTITDIICDKGLQ